jgi:hypothetical protein
MARWRPARDEDELRTRMPQTLPTIWRRAVRTERVEEALRLKRGEAELRRLRAGGEREGSDAGIRLAEAQAADHCSAPRLRSIRSACCGGWCSEEPRLSRQ